MINLVSLLLFLNLSLTNLGNFISENVRGKLDNYIIASSLYERNVIEYKPESFEDFKKFLLLFCKVKIVESSRYTIFEDNNVQATGRD